MKSIRKLEVNQEKEELLPEFSLDFPYIATRAELNRYAGKIVPWHWHRAIELFYMESGSMEYYTPKQRMLFSEGSGGMINSNVLHMTKPVSKTKDNIQLLHIFDPELIYGKEGSRIEKSYVMPVIASQKIEILPLNPEHKEEAKILHLIKNAFQTDKRDIGYELKIRNIMSEIWLMLFSRFQDQCSEVGEKNRNDERLKKILVYIHEHFSEKMSITDLAAVGYISERACFRLFQEYLHTTPTAYIKSYRLQEACRMLTAGRKSVTEIGYQCGFGNGSYFGKVFQANFGMTPVEYRSRWQNITG